MKKLFNIVVWTCALSMLFISCDKEKNPSQKEENLLIAVNLENDVHYIDLKGNVVLRLSDIEWAYGFNEGLACVGKDEKYGFINEKGEVVIPCKYKYPTQVSEGLIPVCNDFFKYGYIDTKGNQVIEFKYDQARDFENGYAIVRTNSGGVGMIDKNGNEIFPCEYKQLGQFSDGLCWYGMGNSYYCVNENKEIVIQIKSDQYDYIPAPFINGLCEVCKDRKYGLINKKGETVLEPIEGLGFSYDGNDIGYAAVVNTEGKWGFVDAKGNLVIPYKYDTIDYFREGLALVWQGDKYGYIDKSGKEVIPIMCSESGDVCVTDDHCYFNKGYVLVEIDGKFYLKNKKGETLLTFDNWYYNIYW